MVLISYFSYRSFAYWQNRKFEYCIMCYLCMYVQAYENTKTHMNIISDNYLYKRLHQQTTI